MMIRAGLFVGLAAALVACAGAPRRPVAAAAKPSIEGTYELKGVVYGIGPVTGWLTFEKEGVVSLATSEGSCSSDTAYGEKTVYVRCSSVMVSVPRTGNELALQASVWVYRPATALEADGRLETETPKTLRYPGLLEVHRTK